MMDILFTNAQPGILLAALLIDAAIGEPEALYRAAPHPVALLGRLIAWAERRFNRESDTGGRRKATGVLVIALLTIGLFLAGHWLQVLLRHLPLGPLWLAIAMSTMLAARSLYDHVAAVATALDLSGVEGGRLAVARIVGRDPESLDESGVCRAAIESLAESFCDGVVAPLFWGLLFGLPGLIAYKAVNTADSMIGHKTPRHADFGWATARLDDLLNFIPARLAALLLIAAAFLYAGKESAGAAWRAARRDAARHRSPNAGWPEAAMGGALGRALAGPRVYDGETVADSWMNADGVRVADAQDIKRALQVYVRACLCGGIALALIAWNA